MLACANRKYHLLQLLSNAFCKHCQITLTGIAGHFCTFFMDTLLQTVIRVYGIHISFIEIKQNVKVKMDFPFKWLKK